MAETYTPGPWKWFNYPDGRKLLVADTRAVIHCPDAPTSVDPPDALLIAAAPDLYEACKAYIDAYIQNDARHDLFPAERMMVDAIAKAEGRGEQE